MSGENSCFSRFLVKFVEHALRAMIALVCDTGTDDSSARQD